MDLQEFHCEVRWFQKSLHENMRDGPLSCRRAKHRHWAIELDRRSLSKLWGLQQRQELAAMLLLRISETCIDNYKYSFGHRMYIFLHSRTPRSQPESR